MKEASRGEKTALQNLMGGWAQDTASGSFISPTASTKDSQDPEGHTAQPQEIYCELPEWFSEKSSLALDAGILHGRLLL